MAGWVWSDVVAIRPWNARTWMSLPCVLTHRTAHMFGSQAPEIDHGIIQNERQTNVPSLNQVYSWVSQQLWVHGLLHSTSFWSAGTSCLLYAVVSSRTSKVIITMPGLGQLSLEQASGFTVKWTTKNHKQQPINTMCYNARKKRKSKRECVQGETRRGKRPPKSRTNSSEKAEECTNPARFLRLH